MTNEQLTQNHDRVSVWDLVMIMGGAIALVATGLIGLGFKAYNNALDPRRAEAVAKSMIDYHISSGSQGKFGIKFAGIKLAIVNGKTSPPDVIILVIKTPLNRDTNDPDEDDNLQRRLRGQTEEEFQVMSSRTEIKKFCNQNLNVTIDQGTLENQDKTVPAVQYSASTTLNNEKLIVVVQALGKNANQKALAVFQSIRCK